MTVTERFPAPKQESDADAFGEITKYDPTQVAGYAQLVERFNREQAVDTPIDTVDSPAETLGVDFVDTSESSSPMFDAMVAEQLSGEPTVDTSVSRLANFLRRTADGVESTSEKIDDAKDRAKVKLRIFGRSALRAATASGELAIGAGVGIANKTVEFADRADAAVIDTIADAKDAAVDKLVGFKDGVKEKLAARKTAALARRQARRDRWAGRVAAAKESLNNGLDRTAELAMAAGAKLETGMDKVGTGMINAQEAVTDKVERTKASIHTTRAAGRAALEAFQSTQRAHAEQNQL